jgi:hypothetical protein
MFCQFQSEARSELRGLPLEQKRKQGKKVRGFLGAGCALVLICAWVSPRAALGQTSSTGTAASTAKPKAKTATPTKHTSGATKSKASASSAKAHSASHPAAGTHAKSSTAVAAHGSKSKYASSRKSGKKKTTARGQQKIDSERAQEIQAALIREHYLTGEADGSWTQSTEDAMRRYQADNGWQSKTVPDSRALISLGLGPNRQHLLNPESAMITGPFPTRAEPLAPASHSADPGAPMNANPAVDPPPATTPTHDASSPQ